MYEAARGPLHIHQLTEDSGRQGHHPNYAARPSSSSPQSEHEPVLWASAALWPLITSADINQFYISN